MMKYNQISVLEHNRLVRDIRDEMVCLKVGVLVVVGVLAAIIVLLANKLSERDKEIAIYQEDLFSCNAQLMEIKFYGTTDQQIILNGE